MERPEESLSAVCFCPGVLNPPLFNLADEMDKFRALKEACEDVYDKHPKACLTAVGATSAALVAALAWRRAANYVPTSGPYPPPTLPADAYDGEQRVCLH